MQATLLTIFIETFQDALKSSWIQFNSESLELVAAVSWISWDMYIILCFFATHIFRAHNVPGSECFMWCYLKSCIAVSLENLSNSPLWIPMWFISYSEVGILILHLANWELIIKGRPAIHLSFFIRYQGEDWCDKTRVFFITLWWKMDNELNLKLLT